MKRKIVAIFAILIFLLTFAACGNPKNEDDTGGDTTETASETFKGVASRQLYESEEAAVKAFLEDEFEVAYDNTDYDFTTGTETTQHVVAFSARYAEHSVTEVLSETEIADLNLDLSERTGLTKAERAAVIFTPYTEVSGWNYTETLGEELVQKLLLLSYTGRYRYYTPLPEVGELLTRSYFESVLDETKYTNCTVDYFSEGSLEEDGKTLVTEQQKFLYKFTSDSYFEREDFKVLYHDGISRDMFSYLFAFQLAQGSITEEYLDIMFAQYSSSEKPWMDPYRRKYYEKYHLPCSGGFGIVHGGYNEDGKLEFEKATYLGVDGIIDEPTKATRYHLGWWCAVDSSGSVYPFYFKKTSTGFSKTAAPFVLRPMDITVVNGRLGTVLSEKTESSPSYRKITFSDFGTTTITPPKEVTALLS